MGAHHRVAGTPRPGDARTPAPAGVARGARLVRAALHHAANLAELREIVPPAARPAHVLLLIDGWDALVDLVAEHNGGRQMDQLTRLLREGAGSGLHVVATSERALLSGRAASLNDDKLLLRLNERTDYQVVGRRRQDLHALGGTDQRADPGDQAGLTAPATRARGWAGDAVPLRSSALQLLE